MGKPPSTRELYDRTARRWVRDAPTSLSDFTARPAVLALCQPVAGVDVLDLGCGEGYCARRIRATGARSVLGIDLSGEMIAAALECEKQKPLGIKYRRGDAAELNGLEDASFDLVVCVFLFNYMDRVQSTRAMTEVARVLRPGGRFVFAVPHPLFAFLRGSAPPFYFDVGVAGYFSARDQRFAGRIWKRDGSALEVQLCHKTIHDYFQSLKDAGFRAMPTVIELGVTEEMIALEPEFFSPLRDTPLHMAVSVER